MGDFKMPSLGAEMESGRLVEWKFKVGDRIKRGDIIAVIDTDKAAVDAEVWENGTIEEILIQPGEKVPVGTVLARIKNDEVTTPMKIPPMEPIATSGGPAPSPPTPTTLKASPAAKKFASENKIDLTTIHGSGPAGAIQLSDIEKKDAMRHSIAAAMEKSVREIPHFYLMKKISIKKCMQWLDEHNRTSPIEDRILLIAPILKAIALAVKEVPEVNGFWKNNRIELVNAIHLNIIISIRKGGIIAPAILNAGDKTTLELMRSLQDLTLRARSEGLKGSELTEGTITVTNLGESETETVLGMIYPPQIVIVGIGSTYRLAVQSANGIEFEPFINLSLAADHRAIDGQTGSQFLKKIEQHLQEPS